MEWVRCHWLDILTRNLQKFVSSHLHASRIFYGFSNITRLLKMAADFKKTTITGRDLIDVHQAGLTMSCHHDRLNQQLRCFKFRATGHAQRLACCTSTETTETTEEGWWLTVGLRDVVVTTLGRSVGEG
jgi:hypothetical protein